MNLKRASPLILRILTGNSIVTKVLAENSQYSLVSTPNLNIVVYYAMALIWELSVLSRKSRHE